jgi:hypothetical protein
VNWISRLWNKRRRDIDLKILWPACKAKSPDLDHAKAAFAYHAFHDEAWMCLGVKEVTRRIDELR